MNPRTLFNKVWDEHVVEALALGRRAPVDSQCLVVAVAVVLGHSPGA